MRLFAGKLGMVCLLAGVLTLGEFGIQMSRPAAVVPARENPDVLDEPDIWDTETQMEAEYHRLEEEEEEKRKLLQEKEAELKAGEEAGQIEVMELEEALRRVQLQKIVLKSRMDEKSFDK